MIGDSNSDMLFAKKKIRGYLFKEKKSLFICKKNIKLDFKNLWSYWVFFFVITYWKIIVSNCVSIFFHQRFPLKKLIKNY